MEILFDYEVIKQLGKGKTGVSYLVKKKWKLFCFKSDESKCYGLWKATWNF